MLYEGNTPQNELNIKQIHFIQSFGYETAFPSEEKSGDFWELLYAEKGTVAISSGSTIHTLSKSSLFFRQPGKSIRINASGTAPAELISIGFNCDSDPMDFFQRGLFAITPSERRILLYLIEEAKAESSAAFASQQLVLLYLQLLLILLIRDEHADISPSMIALKQQRQSEEQLFQSIVTYMEEHINEHLTINQICRDNLVGRGLLQKLFLNNADCGIIDYFSLMKINAAKQLIKENNMNFSQIAERLGYNSIHYFSRHFKKLTGMTPSDYAASVRPS